MSTTELRLWVEREFAQAYAALDEVIYHNERPDRLQEHMVTAHMMVDELVGREL